MLNIYWALLLARSLREQNIISANINATLYSLKLDQNILIMKGKQVLVYKHYLKHVFHAYRKYLIIEKRRLGEASFRLRILFNPFSWMKANG